MYLCLTTHKNQTTSVNQNEWRGLNFIEEKNPKLFHISEEISLLLINSSPLKKISKLF